VNFEKQLIHIALKLTTRAYENNRQDCDAGCTCDSRD